MTKDEVAKISKSVFRKYFDLLHVMIKYTYIFYVNVGCIAIRYQFVISLSA